MIRPLVSIITINYNQAVVTAALLRSIQKISYKEIEVLVVDNGSAENPDALAAEFPWVKLLKTGENLGFSGGNNYGMRQAKGEYFLLLNNDTEVPEGFLEPLVARMLSDEKIGAVSPKILYYDHPDTIQFAGFTPINPYTLRGFAIGSMEKDRGQYADSRETSRAHGAAMLISRKVVKDIGLMPHIYFLYYEEMDYCAHMQKAGYTIWYEGNSYILHKESISTGKKSPLKTYYLTRNRLLYARRNVVFFPRCISMLYFALLVVPKSLLHYLMRKEPAHAKAFLKGIIWNLNHFRIYHTDHLA